MIALPGDVKVGMVHDAGPAAGRLARLRLRFPEADAVVFGHSHLPLHERDGDFQIFNPGQPDRAPACAAPLDGARAHREGAIAFELVPL